MIKQFVRKQDAQFFLLHCELIKTQNKLMEKYLAFNSQPTIDTLGFDITL